MANSVTWILDLHEEFPSSTQLLQSLTETRVISRRDALMGHWPSVEGPVVGYGTMLSMSRLSNHRELGHAIFDDYSKLRCSSYYRWLYDLLGRMALIVPFRALPSLPLDRLFGTQVFLRSDSNFKFFPACVHRVEELVSWMDLYRAHQDELVVLSEPVAMSTEYRCFFREGHYICGSSYPEFPFRPVPDSVANFAQEGARRLLQQGISMCTVDVAEGDRLRLVEVGGVNSWGLYGSSQADFIRAMERQAQQVFENICP